MTSNNTWAYPQERFALFDTDVTYFRGDKIVGHYIKQCRLADKDDWLKYPDIESRHYDHDHLLRECHVNDHRVEGYRYD